MAGLDGHLRLVTCLTTIDGEEAQWGICTGARDDIDVPTLAQIVEAFAETLGAGSGIANILGSSDILGVKVYRWDAAAGSYSLIYERLTALPPVSRATLPLQCSAVLTIRTPEPVGPAEPTRYRNRAYIGPLALVAIDADAYLQLPFISDTLQAAQDMHNAMALVPTTAVGDPGGLAVRSFAGGFIVPAESIEMGRVVDTQRRRRNGLFEGGLSVTL